MRFWQTTAFRVWLVFGTIGLMVSIPLSIYFNSQQREILQDYTKNEFDVNAAIAASVIKQAIEDEALDGLGNYMSNIANHSDFVYIAIIENGEVFSCFPKEFSSSALIKKEEYIYSESVIDTDLISGRLVITASKIKDELILKKINDPFIYLIVISILSSIFLFALSLRFLSKPIFRAIEIAKELEKQNYNVDIDLIGGKNEISILNNSLYSLKENLIQLKDENDNYNDNLKSQNNKLYKMALFPAHNPNPVIELDTDMKIIYHNEACKNHPSIYKLINESHKELNKFQGLLKKTIESKKDGKYTIKEGIKIDEKHFAFNLYIDKKHNFIRLYLTDMTDSIQLQEELKKQRDEIYDSLNYAKIIQESILPDVNIFQEFFESQFFLYKPKDIVSGDFYWATKKGDKLFFALCDCTGHGVPGSLLSMIGYDALNYINSLNSTNGGAIFMNKLNDFFIQSRSEGRMRFNDTMDMIMFMYDPKSKLFCFSGSKQKVIIIRNKQILEFNTDHFNLGDNFGFEKTSFREETLTLEKNDVIYLFTDGYVDQFGGSSGKKLKYPRFRELLLDVYEKPLDEQKTLLDDFLKNWRTEKGEDPYDQLDDVSVIGFKV